MPSDPAPYILSGISDFDLTFRKTYTSAALSSQAQMAMAAVGRLRDSLAFPLKANNPESPYCVPNEIVCYDPR